MILMDEMNIVFSNHPLDYPLIPARKMLKAFFYLTCDEGKNCHKIK